MPRQQLPQDDVLLRPAQEPRSGKTLGGGLGAEQGKGQRRRSAGERTLRRARRHLRDPVTQLRRRPAARSEHQAGSGGGALPQTGEHGVDGHSGLPGARRAQHHRPAAPVVAPGRSSTTMAASHHHPLTTLRPATMGI